MSKNIAISCVIALLLGCAGTAGVGRSGPDLSKYGKIVVSPVNSDKFLAENVVFVQSEELLAGVQHVSRVSHAEIHGYYTNLDAPTGEKELRVDIWLTAFEPEAGAAVPEVAPLDAGLELAAEEMKEAGKSGVGIVVHNVELVDTSTGQVIHFFDAVGEGQHAVPEQRYSEAAYSAAKDIVWRIERMAGRRLQPHRLPSHQNP